jgi:hypothetical protein
VIPTTLDLASLANYTAFDGRADANFSTSKRLIPQNLTEGLIIIGSFQENMSESGIDILVFQEKRW